MSYVDGNTMIEFKDKIVDKVNQKERKIKRNVLLKLNRSVDDDGINSEFFITKNISYNLFEENAVYSFAMGVHKGKYIYKKGNGNQFVPAENDYLHHRKRYYDYVIQNTRTVTYYEIFKFLFNIDLNDYDCEIESTSFPEHVDTPKKLSVKITINDLDAYDFFDYLQFNSVIFKNFNVQENIHINNCICKFNGNLYIVKNKYTHQNLKGKFCEEVYAFMNLLISVNYENNNKTAIYFAKRNYQFK